MSGIDEVLIYYIIYYIKIKLNNGVSVICITIIGIFGIYN